MNLLNELRGLQIRALRKRVWYQLNRLDRALVCLSSRLETVISRVLHNQLAKVVVRLTELLNPVTVLTMTVGKRLASRIVVIAESWGHKSAKKWRTDHRFMRYLTIMEINKN